MFYRVKSWPKKGYYTFECSVLNKSNECWDKSLREISQKFKCPVGFLGLLQKKDWQFKTCVSTYVLHVCLLFAWKMPREIRFLSRKFSHKWNEKIKLLKISCWGYQTTNRTEEEIENLLWVWCECVCVTRRVMAIFGKLVTPRRARVTSW